MNPGVTRDLLQGTESPVDPGSPRPAAKKINGFVGATFSQIDSWGCKIEKKVTAGRASGPGLWYPNHVGNNDLRLGRDRKRNQ